MKELDFDELDRAVNTLMGGVPKTVEPAKQDDVKTLTITPTLTADAAPVMPVGEVQDTPVRVSDARNDQSVVVPQARVAARPAAPAARRSGRFMDVIHPSATPKKATPSQAVSRQGVTLAPLSTPVAEPEEVEAPRAEIAPVATHESVAEAFEPQAWPDPLEFAQADIEPETQAPEEMAPIVAEPAGQEGLTEPLSSPFIPDAKVEKRPLGSPAPEFSPEVSADAEPNEVAPDEESEPIAEPVELPEELQGDLIAIESNESSSDSAVSEQMSTDTESDDKKSEQVVDALQSEVLTTTPAPAPVAVAAVASPALAGPAAAVSIPQQYREEPSTGDETNGSIYDTASYHQPLEHPAKKKTGWLWVIWVLVLLVLGAGGGALAYLYLLQ